MSVGLSEYMNKKPTELTKFLIRITLIVSILIWTILAIKITEHKSTIIVDTEDSECYSDCTASYIALDDTELVEEIDNYKLAIYKENQAERVKIAEEVKKTELEVKRIAKQKADEEAKKKYVAVSRGNDTTNDWIVYEATHYSAFCNTGCTGVTKLGWDVSNTIYYDGYRVIAVDPKKIPLGSLVEVKTTYDTFLALAGDTGGAIKGYRIDILVENDKVAYKLGREKVQVRVIK